MTHVGKKKIFYVMLRKANYPISSQTLMICKFTAQSHLFYSDNDWTLGSK